MKSAIVVSILLFALCSCRSTSSELNNLRKSQNLEIAYWDAYFQNKYPGFRQQYPDVEKLSTDELLVLVKYSDWTYAEKAFGELQRRRDPKTFECLIIIVEDPEEDYRYRDWARDILEEVSGIPSNSVDRDEQTYNLYEQDMQKFVRDFRDWQH